MVDVQTDMEVQRWSMRHADGLVIKDDKRIAVGRVV